MIDRGDARDSLLAGAAVLAPVALGAAASYRMASPLPLGGVVMLVLATSFVFSSPPERVAGRFTAVLLIVLAYFPMHLIESVYRYGELGLLLIGTGLVLARRGFKVGHAWIPLLLGVYFVTTWYATRATQITGASAQFKMHAIVGVCMFALGVVLTVDERRTVVKAIVFIAVSEAVYAIVEFFVQPPVLWASPVPQGFGVSGDRLPHEIIEGAARSQGSFGHPLLLAFVLVVASGLILRLGMSRFWRVTLLGLLAVGVLATGSRSASVALVALLVFAGTRRISLRRGAVLGGLVVALLFFTDFFKSSTYERFATSGSASHRFGALDAVPGLLTEQPNSVVLRGNGWYSTFYVTAKNLLQVDDFVAIDNQWVALLVTTGVIGLVVWVALSLLSLIHCGPQIRLALAVMFGMFLVFDALEFPATWAVLAVMVGIAAGERSEVPDLGEQGAVEDLGRVRETAGSH